MVKEKWKLEWNPDGNLFHLGESSEPPPFNWQWKEVCFSNDSSRLSAFTNLWGNSCDLGLFKPKSPYTFGNIVKLWDAFNKSFEPESCESVEETRYKFALGLAIGIIEQYKGGKFLDGKEYDEAMERIESFLKIQELMDEQR